MSFQVVVDVADVISPCCGGEDGQVGMLALHQIDGGIGICKVADGAKDSLGAVIKGGHTGVIQEKIFPSGEYVVGWEGHGCSWKQKRNREQGRGISRELLGAVSTKE
eukprot:8215885-Ditylum_brightwellii.AAC.1